MILVIHFQYIANYNIKLHTYYNLYDRLYLVYKLFDWKEWYEILKKLPTLTMKMN